MIWAWLLALKPGLLSSLLTEMAPGWAAVARGWLRRWGQGSGHSPRYARLWEGGLARAGAGAQVPSSPPLHTGPTSQT